MFLRIGGCMAAAKRKGLGKKTRFEVFKRDGFKCQYCGRCAPEVVLHADHISPASKGGAADMMNLVTACIDCNLGKSDRALDDSSVVAKQRAQLDELNERREQLEMMLKWRDGLSRLNEASIDAVSERLRQATTYQLSASGRDIVRKLIAQFGLAKVLDALDAAVRQYVKYDEDGKPSKDGVDRALAKLGGFLAIQGEGEDVRQLYYVRGIMRRRFAYCPDWKAIKILRAAHAAGADVNDLKDLAKDCTCWTQFTHALESEYGVTE